MADVYKKYNQKVVLAMINNLDTKRLLILITVPVSPLESAPSAE